MTTNQDVVAVEATVAKAVWRDGFGAVMGLVAGCFPRRETRQTMREMTEAVLMGLERVNCWTLAEALGHSGPHRLQNFLAPGGVGPRGGTRASRPPGGGSSR